MRDEVSYCTTDIDFFGTGARELAFRVARPYLEQEGLTTAELLFGRLRQKVLANDGSRLADLLLRVAALQSQQTRQQVPDRQAELDRLAIAAMRRIDLLTRQTPSDFVFAGRPLSRLADETGPEGLLRAGIILAARLATGDEARKARICLDLLESGASGLFLAHLDQTLAELLRLQPALIGSDGDRLHLIGIGLMLAGAEGGDLSVHPLRERLRAGIDGGDLPLVVAALAELLAEALQAAPLLSEEGVVGELELLAGLRTRISALPLLAGEQALRDALQRRFVRLAGAELLNRGLSELPAYGRKALFLADLYAEIDEGEVRADLLASLDFHFGHRDFVPAFAGPDVTRAEALVLAQKLDKALQHPGFPEHRQARFRDGVATAIAEIQKGGDEAPRDPRTINGAEDCVLVAGESMRLHNWSPVGLLFGPARTAPSVGQTFSAQVTVRAPGLDIRFDVTAEVVGLTGGLIAARYDCIDEAARLAIRQYFAR
ncbi:hypothetical protein [Ferrovibrio sp.]|uniref:hypothetical protein n=1 Tax=Ferrovibrio sp. TaxID=1917215 RepID=UPI00311E31CC